MKAILLLLGITLAFVIQTKISILGVSPDLTAVAAYFLGIKGGTTKGIFFGSIIGIIEDSIGGNILGPNFLGKGVVGFFSSFSSGSLFRWTPLLGAVSLFVLTVIDGLVVLSSRITLETAPTSLSSGIFTLFIQGLFNLPIGIFIRPKNVD